MSSATLAQLSDVEARLPSSMAIEAVRANSLLADASAVVRSYSKQSFTISQTTDKVRPVGYKIKLNKKPVRSIISLALIVANGGSPVPFVGWWWDGSDEVWLSTGDQILNLSEEMQFAMQHRTPIIFATYSHGYDTVPDDVVGVVCSIVIRILTAPSLGGVISEGVGEYNYRLSDAAAQGVMALTEAEKEILKKYRPKSKNTIELRQ
jgi:hypothetical protein